MSVAKFTQPIKINAPGKDIVFDGVDFTGKAKIKIISCNSLTLKNCRVYDIWKDAAPDEQIPFVEALWADSKDGFKLNIEHCFFGENGFYNMINCNQNAPLFDGSGMNENYFSANCTRDDYFAVYNALDGSVFNFNGNEFEVYTHMGIQISIKGNVAATVNFNNNIIGLPAADIDTVNRGLVRFRPNVKQTESFENFTINASGNVFAGEPDRIAFCHYKETDTHMTEDTLPKYYVDGVLTPMDCFLRED